MESDHGRLAVSGICGSAVLLYLMTVQRRRQEQAHIREASTQYRGDGAKDGSIER